jgi:hypothetical protein
MNLEDRYLISSTGRVMSLRKNMIMKPKIDKDGYYRIRLFNGEKKIDTFIHRLVAINFIDNPSGLHCVNHKDEDKKNNNIENLE